MNHEIKDKMIKDVSWMIKEAVEEISCRVWEIYTRSKMDYVDKKDIEAELMELYEDIEGTVRPFD